MDLTTYVNNLGREFATLAEAGGEEARALVERLTGSLESAIRMTLLDALSAAADEISRDLAPGSVELRLRGRDPSFVVTSPPERAVRARGARRCADRGRRREGGLLIAEDGPASRINVRLPEQLKAAIEDAAANEGRSVNAWLVRAAVAALQRVRARPASRAARQWQTDQAGLHRLGALAALAAPRLSNDASPACGDGSPTHKGTTMPSYETPEPISVTLELGVGTVRIAASDRTDTVVEVRPSDEADESDVKAAQQVRVDYANGTLRVAGPKVRAFDFSRKTRSVDVTIELPSGSERLRRDADGRLPLCRPARGVPVQDVRRQPLARTNRSAAPGTRRPVTSPLTASRATPRSPPAPGRSRSARSRARRWSRTPTVTPRSTRSPATCGCARRTATSASTGQARASTLKTSNGSIRVGEVVRGSVVVGTAMGDLDIGIAEGTAAWLEMNTAFGHVRNLLETTSRPEESDETVEVRGRTSYGDITIRRS